MGKRDDAIKKFIAESPPFVLYISGGGFSAIGDLTQFGGSSGKLLEVVCNQATKSTDKLLGYKPEHYVSRDTAIHLAQKAFKRAYELSGEEDCYGVALTSRLTVENERAGRINESLFARQGADYTQFCRFEQHSDTRVGQEKDTAGFLNCLLTGYPFGGRFTELYNDSNISLVKDKNVVSYFGMNNEGKSPFEVVKPVVYSGSFSPLHHGHIEVAKVASEHTGKPVWFEISLFNVDKQSVDFISLQERINAIEDAAKTHKFIAGVVISKQMFFLDKSYAYKKPIFIVGSDTLNRIQTYATGKKDLSIQAQLASFKVSGVNFGYVERKNHPIRLIYDSMKDISFPLNYTDSGISSTEIRSSRKD